MNEACITNLVNLYGQPYPEVSSNHASHSQMASALVNIPQWHILGISVLIDNEEVTVTGTCLMGGFVHASLPYSSLMTSA